MTGQMTAGPNKAPPFAGPEVAAAFAAFAAPERAGLMELRQMIFAEAAARPEVGALDETLKWGQPAYLTAQTRAGTTLRLGCPKTGGFAIFVHCQTRVLPEFRALFPDRFTYDGNRGVLFAVGDALPAAALSVLIGMALTYHLPAR